MVFRPRALLAGRRVGGFVVVAREAGPFPSFLQLVGLPRVRYGYEREYEYEYEYFG